LLKPSDLIVVASIAAGVMAAAVIDIRTRRVPNWLTALIASVGVLFAASGIGRVSIGAALGGVAVGLLLTLPGHVFGGLGAGDVKLVAAVGALMGPWPIARTFLYTAIAGGALAVAISLWRRQLTATLGRTASLVMSPATVAPMIEHSVTNNRFPYAPAVAVGALIVAIGL
jgi:prepilin peptidase CpaA